MDGSSPCLENKLSKVSERSGEFRDAPPEERESLTQEDSQITLVQRH